MDRCVDILDQLPTLTDSLSTGHLHYLKAEVDIYPKIFPHSTVVFPLSYLEAKGRTVDPRNVTVTYTSFRCR